jgi:crotonobetainyl-CoA:carnitine CoA-transferase CaiB-like acyl-CoA transferase
VTSTLGPRELARPPLEGLLVVGLEHSVAGPLCTRILSDLGARSIKVERPPHGDFARRWDGNVHGDGAQFWWLNRGKESALLDLKSSAGRLALDALLERADVFVCNLSPGAVERLGLDGRSLAGRFPKLVNCQISGYGAAGAFRDRKAYDMLVQAEAGVMSLTGSPDQPSRAGVSVADVGTGIYGAALVLAALLGRMRDGMGRHLDVSMYDATIEFAAPMLISFMNAGVVYPRLPDRHHAIAPYGLFRCADGSQLLIAVEHDSEWRSFAEAILGQPELADDSRFSTNLDRLENRDVVDRLVAGAIGKLDRADAERAVADLGLAYASLNDMKSVSEHPVLIDRAIVEDAETEDGATARALSGIGARAFLPGAARRARPPALGEDTDAILDELGIDSVARSSGTETV